MSDKKVISCPNCSKNIRIPKEKHTRFTCPDCKEGLEFNDGTSLLLRTEEMHEPGDSHSNDIIDRLSFFAAFPVFIIFHKVLPDLDWKFHIDRIILFILTLIIIKRMFQSVRILLIIIFLVSYGCLIYGTIWGNYGFNELYNDYAALIKSLQRFK